MMDVLSNDGSCCAELKSVQLSDDSILGRLKREQQRAANKLDVVTQAIEALEKNPELAKTLELIQRAGR